MMLRMADGKQQPHDRESAADNPAHEDDAIDRRITDQPTVAAGRWVRRAVWAFALIVLAYIGWRLSASFFPRWWAQRIADQVDRRFTAGILWGLFYGFVFTFVPLLVLFQIRRRFFSWTWRIIVAMVALLLAAPNWMTLAIVNTNSNAAHAAERVFDTEAPGFRWATLWGVVLGGLLAIIVTGTNMRMKHRKSQVEKLKEERDALRDGQDGRDKGTKE